MPIDEVPKNSNVTTRHVIYKVKENDGGSFKMKVRIAPHCNKNKDSHDLKTDSSQFPRTDIHIAESIPTIKKWPVAKIKFSSVLLQTGDAKRYVYVTPSVNVKIITTTCSYSHLTIA